MLPDNIIECVLEWVFDPRCDAWCETARLRTGGSGNSGWIDFIWSKYVVAPRPHGLHVERAECIMETVLRQSDEMYMLVPWCRKVNNMSEEEKSEKLRVLSGLSKCMSFLVAFVDLASVGSASGMDFLVRIGLSPECAAIRKSTAFRLAFSKRHLGVLRYLAQEFDISKLCCRKWRCECQKS